MLEVFQLIVTERKYQEKVWNCETTDSCGQHIPGEWFMYIEDYVNQAKHILTKENVQVGYPLAMAIMRKIAALAVAAMEQLETPAREL